MWIIKLGGSLTRDATLPQWLRMVAEFGGGRVTVVPGGARFADAVRHAQTEWRFDDLAAHNMAALAMAQTALMLHALEPRLMLVRHDADIRRVLRAGKPALWLPFTLLRSAPDELTSWDVTSDSLALWLARRLNAEKLIVVKSCAIDPLRTLSELVAAEVLDARFADWAQDAAFPIEIVQSRDISQVRNALVGAELPDEALPAGADPGVPSSNAAMPRRARRKPLALP